jgi:hypothetical protein
MGWGWLNRIPLLVCMAGLREYTAGFSASFAAYFPPGNIVHQGQRT